MAEGHGWTLVMELNAHKSNVLHDTCFLRLVTDKAQVENEEYLAPKFQYEPITKCRSSRQSCTWGPTRRTRA